MLTYIKYNLTMLTLKIGIKNIKSKNKCKMKKKYPPKQPLKPLKLLIL